MRWLTLLLILFWPALAAAEAPAARLIEVSATGTVTAVPDMAVVRLGVAREARTADAAMEAASEAAARVLAALDAADIAERDVQTAGLGLHPVYDQSNARPRQIRGYSASNDVTVRVRELAALGGLLDKLVAEGANTLNGLSLAVAEPGPLEAEARAAAVEEARAKAETLAGAAGVSLGPVRSIREDSGGGGPGPTMRGTMMEAAVPVAAGEMEISVSVTVTYAIE